MKITLTYDETSGHFIPTVRDPSGADVTNKVSLIRLKQATKNMLVATTFDIGGVNVEYSRMPIVFEQLGEDKLEDNDLLGED